jgi:hypothetical protein
VLRIRKQPHPGRALDHPRRRQKPPCSAWFRYARTYLREVGHHAPRGFHPLDVALGLVGDRFSWNLLTMTARLVEVTWADLHPIHLPVHAPLFRPQAYCRLQ